VPIELDRIVGRALAKRPDDRYQSVADLISELKLQRRESDRRAMATESRGAIPQRRDTVRNLAVGLISLTLIGGGAAYFLTSVRSDAETAPRFANLTQVTSSIGVEDYPTMSPDGRTLAYEADQSGNLNIWVAQIGGGAAINRTPDHAGDDRFPSWSPDGRQIAFWSSREGGGCFVMSALAGPARKLATSGPANMSRPQWSKDAGTVACVVAPLDAVNNVSAALVSLASGEAKQVPLPGVGRRFDLAWTTDGRAFAYVDSSAGLGSDVSQLLVVQNGSDQAIEVTDGRSKVRSPFWSADAGSLYFVTNREGAMDLWRQKFTGGGKLDGTPSRVTTGLDVRQASLSADGTKVAYSKGRDVANIWRIPIVSDRPTSWADAKQITFDRAFVEFVDLSPDGQRLAVSSDRSGNHDLWVLPADGGEMRPLTTDPTPDWAPRWSPDGKSIAFYAYRTGNRDVWVMPVDGGAARQLTTYPGADLQPHWLSDGRRLGYVSTRNGPSSQWVVSIENGESVQMPGFGQGNSPLDWSHDGRWSVFSSRRPSQQSPSIFRATAEGDDWQQLSKGPGLEPVWSPDDREIYFHGDNERAGNLWAVSLADHRERPVTALTGRRGSMVVHTPATDGRRLFFSWREDDGDIWVMDVVAADRR
jgi:Tol biopolymer transport system component